MGEEGNRRGTIENSVERPSSEVEYSHHQYQAWAEAEMVEETRERLIAGKAAYRDGREEVEIRLVSRLVVEIRESADLVGVEIPTQVGAETQTGQA